MFGGTRSGKIRRLVLTVSALGLVLGIQTACSSGSGDKGASAGASGNLFKLTFQTDYLPSGTYAYLQYALDHGYYKDEGLDVKLEYSKGSVITGQAVSAGKIDIGDMNVGVMEQAVTQGASLISVGTLYGKLQYGFWVPKDSDIKSISDLAHKRIVEVGTPNVDTALVPAVLGKAGISLDDVELVKVDATATISTYGRGAGDALVFSIPNGAATIQDVRPSDPMPWADAGINVPDSSFVTSKKFLNDHPDEVAAFLRATYRGRVDAYAHAQDAVDAYIKKNPTLKPDSTMKQMTGVKDYMCSGAMSSDGNLMGYQNPTDWADGLKFFQEYAGVSKDLTVDDVMTNRFFDDDPVTSVKCPFEG